MENFNELVQIIDRLLAPNGCPWDREQTLVSMRNSLMEETCETIEAINLDDNNKIAEELGDLLFNVIFLCKLAEKEGRFTLDTSLDEIKNKLIRRHPHIFGDTKISTSEEVLKQWNEIKAGERQNQPQSILSTIPHELPTLMRAQKIIKKLQKTGHTFESTRENFNLPNNENELGEYLFELTKAIQDKGLDAEQALRKYLAYIQPNR